VHRKLDVARCLAVAGFDAELYLRVTGEKLILDRGPRGYRPWDSPLLEYARALIAIGAIKPARARAVIDDYSLAEAVRSDEGRQHYGIAMAHRGRSRRSRSVALKPRRVVPCDRTIEDANGALHVRHVTLSEDSTSLAVTWRPNLSGRRRSDGRGHMLAYVGGPRGPVQRTLTDDRGTSVGTGFSGGGSDEQWQGHLTAAQPLAPDTAWIEIDGERLDLTGEAITCEVTIEPLAEQRTAHAYLWHRLAIPGFPGPPEIEGSIDALIAAGALEPDDPVLTEIRAVRDVMPRHPGMPYGGRGRSRSLPEPWRSLLRRPGDHGGPDGTITLSAVTPPFDGFSVAISSLESRADGFSVEVDVAPGLVGRGPSRELESRELAWWAADERGNHHLGQLGSWSGSENHTSGEINFWPALRSKARYLSIMPTGEVSRAVITIPLVWAAAGGPREEESA